MSDREAFVRLRQIIDDWRSGSLPPQRAMGAVGEVLGLAAEAAPAAQDIQANGPCAEEAG